MTSIYTAGHSTRSAGELITLLRASGLEAIADVRRWPVSARYPHFSRAALEAALSQVGIAYHYLGELLGGYRKGGYVSHMESSEFAGGLATLERLAAQHRVAIL